MILSTGMATLEEVTDALGVLAYGYGHGDAPGPAAFAAALDDPQACAKLREQVTVLQCTSAYPASLETINLRVMDTFAESFGLQVGLSDHSVGTLVPVAAVARGAKIIEKHLTLDRSLPGPDQRSSLEPAELARMIADIRAVEVALGDGVKHPLDAERQNIPIVRKSLVAARDVAAGELLTTDNLTTKRPGSGLSPFLYWDLLGTPARRAYRADEIIDD